MPELGPFQDEMDALAERIAEKAQGMPVEPTLFMFKPGQDVTIVGFEVDSNFLRGARLYLLAHEPTYACLTAETVTPVGDMVLAHAETPAGTELDYGWLIHRDANYQRAAVERMHAPSPGRSPWAPLYLVDDWVRNLYDRAKRIGMDAQFQAALAADNLTQDEVRAIVKRTIALQLAEHEVEVSDMEAINAFLKERTLS